MKPLWPFFLLFALVGFTLGWVAAGSLNEARLMQARAETRYQVERAAILWRQCFLDGGQ